MNGRTFNLETPQPLLHLVAGMFTGNGGASPSSSTFTSDDIKSVTWTAAGTFTVELRHTWPSVVSIKGTCIDPTPDNNGMAVIVSETIATDGKFVLKYRVNNVDTNPDSTMKVGFIAILKNRR